MVTLRSSTSHLVLTLAATCVHLAAWANEEPSAPPRTLMRLPGWIESLGEDQARPAVESRIGIGTPAPIEALEPQPADRRGVARPVADWSATPPGAAPTVMPVAAPATPAPAASSSPASSFRRWITERVATLPKPTEPASPADVA